MSNVKIIWEKGSSADHRMIAMDTANNVVLEILESDDKVWCERAMKRLLKRHGIS